MTAKAAAKKTGFKHKNGDALEYLIPKAAFDKLTRTLGGPVVVARDLNAKGVLQCENAAKGKYQIKRQLSPQLRMRVYCVSSSITRLR